MAEKDNEEDKGETEVKIEGVEETSAEPENQIVIDGVSPAPGEEENEATPAWVKELRKNHRESQKRIRELEAQVEAAQPKAAVAQKPTLESCEYDEAKYDAALTTWFENKRKLDDEQVKEQTKAQKLKSDYDTAVQTYRDESKTLGVRDFDDAEAEAKNIFSVIQQGIIVKGASNPAKVMYALGKNPELARKLAALDDHINFAFEVARLEGKIVTKSKTPPKPETVIRSGGAPLSDTANKRLDQLRAQAEKTGDFTEVVKYKRQMKEQRAAR